ncbi:MAG: hypothetical protein IPQ02_15905 [Saprospiraceae bacterium]|nr:hypothetical protein [Candidatus Defluviibacterium haderslevense]
MKFEETIILITLVVFFVVIIVIVFIVIQQRRYIRLENEKKSLEKIQEIRLAEAMIRSQELERKSIGENLHEDVAPILYLSLMDLNAFKERNEFGLGSKFQFTINNLSTAINKIRDISHLIHPASVETFGFMRGLEDFCSIINSSQGCKFGIENRADTIPLDSFKQLMLFRVVQEIVYNSIIHGNAKKIDLILKNESNQLNMSLYHNGNKFMNIDYLNGLQSNGALGLKNIQHRIGLLQGHISFDTTEDIGIQKVSLMIPLS